MNTGIKQSSPSSEELSHIECKAYGVCKRDSSITQSLQHCSFFGLKLLGCGKNACNLIS